MVGLRRFGPLMAATALGFAVLVGRLFEVQIVQHEVWAKEAANLVRSWTIEPFRRGAILDRDQVLIARDEERYEVDLVWRDFRRGQILGQVAQARSLLVMRPIPLLEAMRKLLPWSLELVRLSPQQIDSFGKGAAVVSGSLEVAATHAPAEEQRWPRRGDLHFYVKALLDVRPKEARKLRSLRGEQAWKRPYVEILAAIRGLEPSDVESELALRVQTSLEHTQRVAELFVRDEPSPEPDALVAFVERVENARRRVEDAAADDLFRTATGFGAWRLSADNLERIDLDWLRRALYWDDARLADWILRRGAAWEELVDEYLAGMAIACFKSGHDDPGERVLDGLAHFFRPGDRVIAPELTPWREIDDLVVLRELPALFEGGRPIARGELPPVLPFQLSKLRETPRRGLELVEAVLAGSAGPETARELFDAARDVARPTWNEDEGRAAGLVLREWNRELQRVVGGILERSRAADPGASGRLVLRRERHKNAVEERDYAVRDHGARPQTLVSAPSDELVLLVTRFPDRHAGLAVRTTTRRVLMGDARDPQQPSPAVGLIGDVRSPYLVDVLESAGVGEEIFALRTSLQRSRDEQERLAELVGASLHSGQKRGGRGIEGYFDRLLSGSNGFRERQGLEERRHSGSGASSREPVHGLDLVLTLDLDLQAAAESLLRDPPPAPPEELRADDEWTAHPVGAIVLATPTGDVLAAASIPDRPPSDGAAGSHQDGQRLHVLERTLRQYVMQPPGSVFKPFVALWALEYRGLDPNQGRVACVPSPDGLPRWGSVHCHSSAGHSADPDQPLVDLPTALRRSCNVYFANLGDLLFDGDAFRELAAVFGFGRPTGVRALPSALEGLGLREDHAFRGPVADARALLAEPERQRLGNGLSHISVTPMQVARAYAGLATGVLPQMRLVQGHEELMIERRAEPLPFSPGVLDIVRRSLVEVVTHPQGSASGKGLDRDTLGYQVALKTGSADYREGLVPRFPLARRGAVEWVEGMRKHTWVAGWAPADDPKLVFVVFVHDTAATASHGAVYLASHLLGAPAVRAYLSAAGSGLEAGR